MEPIISDLLTRFEKGSLSRRELVQGLAMLAATGTAAAAQEEIDFKERGASKMAGDRTVDWDNVKPTEIEHKCEEIFHGEALEQKYNYIVYHFDCNGTYFWARTYTDEIGTVSVHGPFESRETMKLISGSLDEAMLSYFRQRFRKIQTLGNQGYMSVWSR